MDPAFVFNPIVKCARQCTEYLSSSQTDKTKSRYQYWAQHMTQGDTANQFAMRGLNMAFTAELTCEGKPLTKMLFIDIMTEKSQMLINKLNICIWVYH